MSLDDIPFQRAASRRLAQRDAQALAEAKPPRVRLDRAGLRLRASVEGGLSPAEMKRLQRLAFPEVESRSWRTRVHELIQGRRMHVALAAAAALAVGVLWFAFVRPLPSADAERWLIAEQAEHRHVLADGSSISLSPGARGWLSQQENATRFELKRGFVQFEVNPSPDQSWSVTAGEYEVRVVGTRFSVRYEPEQSFEVHVEQGVVAVLGPNPESRVHLKAGERLVASLKELGTEPQAAASSDSRASATTASGDEPASEPATAGSQTSVEERPKTSATSAARTSDSGELRLLQQARSALAQRNYESAQHSLASHWRRFPTGQLAEEREALQVEVLRGLGRDDEARRASSEFRKRYPRSVLSPQMGETPPKAP